MYCVINGSTTDAVLQAAKMDHVLWKSEIYQVMLGVSDKSADDFTDSHSCQFGKWYFQGEGTEKHANNGAFKQLDAPHAQVHNYGLSALKSMRNGDMTQAIKDLAIMESASVDMINLLTSLSHQIKRS